ncbi:MAG: 50S ribosomal protein L13 [Solobacterium sp.]|jgi:large subunit ribosomal protein L13|nr:50S ribosomal protein L13 [Solobacterium sp.]MCH4048647.1 50S ribosomal protein L13 [Solobacterium sp.]MCH4075662.1 50S ribosomal protein L13 [Solobacterium sp.]MCI1314669.1 50S ribosomal protein L13 [Solobacterium sp.]MCI1346922.1 50S ribosomal protein L13 [Solobacterium sp.]
MRQTTMAKPAEVKHQWYVVDATDCVLGRLASQVATVLRGKNKPIYTPNVDCGDYVIVINADKVRITGDQDFKKFYFSHSQYPNGLRVRSTKEMREKYTVEWVEKAIMGMLPHNKLGDVQRKHLFVYEGPEHPHAAQQPVELKIK